MVGSFENPILQWIITILLECTFLGFCFVFIGYGWSELQKRKQPFKNMILIGTGGLLFVTSLWATYLLLQ